MVNEAGDARRIVASGKSGTPNLCAKAPGRRRMGVWKNPQLNPLPA